MKILRNTKLPTQSTLPCLISMASFSFLFCQLAIGQGTLPPTGCSCKNEGGDDDDARTPITANLAAAVKDEIVSTFDELSADSATQMKKLEDSLSAFESQHQSKSWFTPDKFLELKNGMTAELRAKIQAANREIEKAIADLGQDIGTKVENKINRNSPSVVGLAQYAHCLDPCEYQNGKPGWSHYGDVLVDGVTSFSASGSVIIGPLDISVSGSIPGFAELQVGGTVSGELSGSIAGTLSPGVPTPIVPKNKPKGEASVIVSFPITGTVGAASRTLLVGAKGELQVTVNKPIGPLKLTYEAEDNCDIHP